MRTRALFILLLLVLFSGLTPIPVHADGIIIPEPPVCDPGPCPPLPLPMDQLAIKYHHVSVKIENQVAVTHVDQVFYNPNDWTVEGTYLFPLPQDAAVSNFILWIDGEPVQGEVLDAEQARQKYDEIVRTLQDPALLEYAGRGAVQASIFPIPPQGERRIELEYTQALTAENGLVRYVYPLNTEKFSALPLESVSIKVEIQSQEAIRAVYSPTHSVDVQRENDQNAIAGYEASNILPDSDFALYYSIGESQAFHLLSYRDPGDPVDPDGFFLVLLAPRSGGDTPAVPKDVILVLDRSGSMEGEKFVQAQEALRYVLRHLKPEDRFNIISFSTGLETYASALRGADEAGEALAWVDRLSAQGSTDINRALLEASAMVDRERPTYLIFMTDGLPTEGETDPNKILENFAASAPQNLRVFSFGVGFDVDTILLDTLAQENHGTSSYVRPGEPLNEILSAFYTRISTPVLTGLELDFGSLATYDMYPSPLPDLFLGSQIVGVGRYKKGGTTDITLSGEVNGATQTFTFPGQQFSEESASDPGNLASLPRLWATRKIGYLLGQLRLKGNDQETIDQIVRLSIRYGIVTPYTSYLVTEPMPFGVDARERIAEEQFNQAQAAPMEPRSGQEAVEKAAGQSDMQQAEAPAAAPAEVSSQIRVVGSRTFVLNEDVWMDTGYDPQSMAPIQVVFLSDAYFALIHDHPELAPSLALGPRVILWADGQTYEIVPASEGGEPQVYPVTATPTPQEVSQVDPTATPQPPVVPTAVPTQPRDPGEPVPAEPTCLLALFPLALVFLLLSSLKPRG